METEIQLLKQIAENTTGKSSLYVALVAGCSAVAGALVTAILSYLGIRHTIKNQYRIERQKLQANIISTERLRWLQDIRQKFSDLYVQMDMQYNHLKRPLPNNELKSKQQELDEFSKAIMRQTNFITLMLNPQKEEQKKLRDALQKSQAFLLGCFKEATREAQTFDDVKYQALKQSAFDSLTRIGTRTWNQIKELQ